jgi:hypothetical protein
MAEYYDMKDKMRRAAQDEQAARFRATTGNDPYAAEIIAGESRVAAPPRAAASDAGPQGTVRGVPEGMTAEYYAPPAQTPAAPTGPASAPAAPAGPSPAEAAVARLRSARAERDRVFDVQLKSAVGSGALGAAVGAGLGGPPGALIGVPLGFAGGMVASRDGYRVSGELSAAKRSIIEGLRDGTFTKEQVKAALGGEDVDAALTY